MATPVIMPRQGNSVESCIITEWFVKKGQEVAEGDVLFSYETDKAAFEEESKVSGTVLELFPREGDDVPVLTNVCVIGEQGEDITPFVPEGAQIDNTEQQEGANASSDSAENQTVKEIEVPDTIEPQHEQIALKTDGEIFISPRARNLAEKLGQISAMRILPVLTKELLNVI